MLAQAAAFVLYTLDTNDSQLYRNKIEDFLANLGNKVERKENITVHIPPKESNFKTLKQVIEGIKACSFHLDCIGQNYEVIIKFLGFLETNAPELLKRISGFSLASGAHTIEESSTFVDNVLVKFEKNKVNHKLNLVIINGAVKKGETNKYRTGLDFFKAILPFLKPYTARVRVLLTAYPQGLAPPNAAQFDWQNLLEKLECCKKSGFKTEEGGVMARLDGCGAVKPNRIEKAFLTKLSAFCNEHHVQYEVGYWCPIIKEHEKRIQKFRRGLGTTDRRGMSATPMQEGLSKTRMPAYLRPNFTITSVRLCRRAAQGTTLVTPNIA